MIFSFQPVNLLSAVYCPLLTLASHFKSRQQCFSQFCVVPPLCLAMWSPCRWCYATKGRSWEGRNALGASYNKTEERNRHEKGLNHTVNPLALIHLWMALVPCKENNAEGLYLRFGITPVKSYHNQNISVLRKTHTCRPQCRKEQGLLEMNRASNLHWQTDSLCLMSGQGSLQLRHQSSF